MLCLSFSQREWIITLERHLWTHLDNVGQWRVGEPVASGFFLLLFYIFISESGCSFIVSQQMICLVGKELQSFFLHVYVLPKKNKETNSVVWLDNNKHLIVNFFSLLLHRFGGITLLRLYFYKQNIYLGRLRTAKM